MSFKHNCSYRGNTKGGLFYRGRLEAGKGGSRNGTALSLRALRGEPGERASLLETERYVKEGSGNGASLSLLSLYTGTPLRGT